MDARTINDPIILIPWPDKDHHDQFVAYLRTEAGADFVMAASLHVQVCWFGISEAEAIKKAERARSDWRESDHEAEE
jgi:hypothetical protein